MTYRANLFAGRVDELTFGAAVPVLSAAELSDTAQLLGTVNNNRGRWNPFLPENNMRRARDGFVKEIELKANGGRHGDGVYAVRFVTNHNLRQSYKADHQYRDAGGKPKLVTGPQSHQAQNVMFQVLEDGIYRFHLHAANQTFDISPSPRYLTEIESVQINGFVWNEDDDFQKFDETRGSHEMTRIGDCWEKCVYLKSTGGMRGRDDGVYQFLFSANRNEDWGFAGFNHGDRLRLTGGTGFGSSGGQSCHSAITIKVNRDGYYTIRMNPQTYRFEVEAMRGCGADPIEFLNDATSYQLLGTIHARDQFDPTIPDRHMLRRVGDGNIWLKTVDLNPGVYSANFAISQELFLDTMALGAWLDSSTERKLVGRAWHGKPNEPNVFFEVRQQGTYRFGYDTGRDEFSIAAIEGGPLVPIVTIDSLQLVGDPVGSWDPGNRENNMERLRKNVFTKTVRLERGTSPEHRYRHYKYTANNWPWLWTFADYELDGYGHDYLGQNPAPQNARVEDLRRYGHLTTHGDPAPLQCEVDQDGDYRFTVDLETGAYATHRVG